MVMHQVFCVYVIADSLVYFVGLLTVAVGVYLTVLTAFRTFFLPIGCLVHPQYKDFHLDLYLVLCCLAVIFWRPHLFEGKNRMGVDLWQRRGGGNQEECRQGKLWLGCKKKDKQYCQNKSFSILKYANFMIFILKHFTVCI